MKKMSIIGVLMGAAMVCAAPISLNQSPDKGLPISLNSAEARIGRPLTPWECCWRQPASAPQSISPLRVWCYLLLNCALCTTSEAAFDRRLLLSQKGRKRDVAF
jgi:hypothetical protein